MVKAYSKAVVMAFRYAIAAAYRLMSGVSTHGSAPASWSESKQAARMGWLCAGNVIFNADAPIVLTPASLAATAPL